MSTPPRRTPPWRTSRARRVSRGRWSRSSCARARRSATTAARACWRRRRSSATGPNANARSLASRRTRTVGVLLNDLHNPFFAEIADGIEDVASRLGYRLLLSTGGRRPERERAMLEALLEYRTDGLILVSPRMETRDIVAAAALDRGRRHRPASCAARRSTASRPTRRSARGWPCSTSSSSATSASSTSTAAAAPARRPARAGYLRAMREVGLGARAAVIPGEFTETAGRARRRAAARVAATCRPRSSPPTT